MRLSSTLRRLATVSAPFECHVCDTFKVTTRICVGRMFLPRPKDGLGPSKTALEAACLAIVRSQYGNMWSPCAAEARLMGIHDTSVQRRNWLSPRPRGQTFDVQHAGSASDVHGCRRRDTSESTQPRKRSRRRWGGRLTGVGTCSRFLRDRESRGLAGGSVTDRRHLDERYRWDASRGLGPR